jgi:hypothetical protein
MSAQLPLDVLQQLLDDHHQLLRERAQIVDLLTELEPRFRAVRDLLNRLHRLLESQDFGQSQRTL